MIEIDYPNEAEIYCPACGITIHMSYGESGDKFEMNECPHLVWLGTDEGPEFDRLDRKTLEGTKKATKDLGAKKFTDGLQKLLDDLERIMAAFDDVEKKEE